MKTQHMRATARSSADPRGGIEPLSWGSLSLNIRETQIQKMTLQKRRPLGAGRRWRGGLRP